MVRNHQYDFVSSGREKVPGTFLLPRDVAQSWFRRAILRREMLIDPPPVRSHLLLSVIDRGLRAEWNAQWRMATRAEDAQKVFSVVGTPWLSENIRNQSTFTLLMRFLVSDVYLGSLHLPEDDLFDVFCPICGEGLSRQHILEECRGLSLERALLCRDLPDDRISDLGWLARHGERPLSRFLVAVQARFAAAGGMAIQSAHVEVLPDAD